MIIKDLHHGDKVLIELNDETIKGEVKNIYDTNIFESLQYIIIKMPDGTLRKVHKSEINNIVMLNKSEGQIINIDSYCNIASEFIDEMVDVSDDTKLLLRGFVLTLGARLFQEEKEGEGDNIGN